MGIYRYTLRKETRSIGGLTIGQFGYAYKESFWNDSGPYKRRVALAERKAEDARDANPELSLAIMGSFREISTGDQPVAVFDCGRDMTAFYDSRTPGPIVGHVRREGRNLVFESVIV